MPVRRLLLLLFVLALVLSTAVIERIVASYSPRHGWGHLWALGWILGQMAILGIWFGAGSKNLVVRTAGLIAGSVYGAFYASRIDATPAPTDWISAETIQLALPWLGFLGVTNLAIAMPWLFRRWQQKWFGSEPRQTTIAGLLSLTTAVALVLGAGRQVRLPDLSLGRLILLCLALAIVPWVRHGIWQFRLPRSITVVAYVLSGSVAWCLTVVAGTPGRYVDSAMVIAMQTAVIALYYVVLQASVDSPRVRTGEQRIIHSELQTTFVPNS